ncbi:unnamed protein product [Lampetra fluviatilis]
MQGTVRATGAGHLQRAQRVARDRLLRQLERQRVHCVRELDRRVDAERRLLAAIAESRCTAATLAGPVAAAVAAAATAVTATTRSPVPRGRAERSSLVPGEHGYRRIAQADLEEMVPTYTGGDELRAADGREELPLAFPCRHRSRQRRGCSPAARASAPSGPRTGVRARRDEAARARKAERARRRRERITERTRLPPLWGRGRHGEGAGEAAPEQGDWARVLRDVRYLRIRDCGEGSQASGEPEQGSRDGSAVE